MKVSLFTYKLSGGAFTHGYTALAQGLIAQGVTDIDLVYIGNGQEDDLRLFPAAVRPMPLPASRSRYAPFAIARYIRQEKPDVAIAMPLHMNLAAILGKLLARRPETTLIVSERATLSYTARIQNRSNPLWRAMPTFVRLLYPHADGVVCNSEDVALDLRNEIALRIPDDRLVVIPPAVALSEPSNATETAAAHPWFDDPAVPVLITVARLTTEKNLPLLIEALARVQPQQACRLMVLGEGPERATLEASITRHNLQDKVYMPGYVRTPRAYIQRSTAFVLSSQQEAFGRVLIEAMSTGVPVVATDAIGGGPRSVLDGGRYGILVPNEDVDALAKAILQVIREPETAARLRQLGRQRVSLCDPTQIAQQWLDFATTLKATAPLQVAQ